MTEYITYPDRELINLLKENSHDAFNEIHHRNYARLIRYAYNITRDKEASTDIVQDVLLWFWEHREQHKMDSISGYLTIAVKYQIANYIRKGKIKEAYQNRVINIPYYTVNEENLELEQLKRVITSFTHQLPEKCAVIFRMSREEYLTNKEIALKLGISEATVAVQIKRALDKLRFNLGKMDFWMYFFL